MRSLLRDKFLAALGFALLLSSAYRALVFSISHWQMPWPATQLTIDGMNFLAGARRIAEGEGLLAMEDTYHSPGYQILLGLMLKLAGSTDWLITWSKILNLACFGAALFFTFSLARRRFGERVAAIATLIFACSLNWLYYCHMIMYEVPLGTLLIAWLWLELRNRGENLTRENFLPVLSGLLLFAVILIHGRYLFLLALPAISIWKRRKGAWLSLSITLLPLLGWCVAYSLRAGKPQLIMDRRDFLFRLGNNPNAFGGAFPHPPIAEPSGWAFVFGEPLNFLWLVKERFLLLFGLKPDVWAIPSPNGMPLIALTGLVVFLAGCALAASDKEKRTASFPLWLVLGASFLLPLLVFANHRLIVPTIPLMAIFQAIVVEAIYFRKREA